MAVPKPTTALEAVAIAGGAIVALLIVLPLVPLVVELVVGVVRAVLDTIVPGGRTYE